MRLRQVRARIYAGLREIAARGDFLLRRSDEGFRRRIPGGYQKLSIAVWDYHPTFLFSLTMGIRLDEVEALCNRFSDVDPRYDRETLTSITQLEHLGEEPTAVQGVVYSGTTEDEIDAAIERAALLIEAKVFPFFDRYRTVAALDAAMNPETPVSSDVPGWSSDRHAFNSTYHPRRGMSALIVAHLAGNPRIEDLAERYRAEMVTLIPEERARFERVVAYLQEERGCE